jgi:hypothetical protein
VEFGFGRRKWREPKHAVHPSFHSGRQHCLLRDIDSWERVLLLVCCRCDELGTNTDPNADSYLNCHTDSYSNWDTNSNPDCNTFGYANTNVDAHIHNDADSNTNGYTDTHTKTNSYPDGNAKLDADAKTDADSQTASGTKAPTNCSSSTLAVAFGRPTHRAFTFSRSLPRRGSLL